jgi:hypothetical protein
MFHKNDHAIEELLTTVHRVRVAATKHLNLDLLMAGDIDEVSLLFLTEVDLHLFCAEAIGRGWDHFNGVSDTLFRMDDPGSFDVRFEFLKHPTDGYRIEAMAVTSDINGAPLHSAALATHGAPCPIHASYKLANAEDYEGAKIQLHRHYTPVGGKRAEYRNTYGQFAYYGEPKLGWLLKPRVNLRDA